MKYRKGSMSGPDVRPQAMVERIKDLPSCGETLLPYPPVEEREGKIPPNNHDYKPAKPLEKTKIIKQKKREFPKK